MITVQMFVFNVQKKGYPSNSIDSHRYQLIERLLTAKDNFVSSISHLICSFFSNFLFLYLSICIYYLVGHQICSEMLLYPFKVCRICFNFFFFFSKVFILLHVYEPTRILWFAQRKTVRKGDFFSSKDRYGRARSNKPINKININWVLFLLLIIGIIKLKLEFCLIGLPRLECIFHHLLLLFAAETLDE